MSAPSLPLVPELNQHAVNIIRGMSLMHTIGMIDFEISVSICR